MLIIRKILDKDFQKELCGMCSAEYNPAYFAYMAADGHTENSGAVIDSYIGILQFTMDGGGGYINTLKPVLGVDDDEALIIMERAVMEYMYTGELPYVYIDEDACDGTLIDKMGFRKNEHGEYCIDLEKFYESPCGYNKNLQ